MDPTANLIRQLELASIIHEAERNEDESTLKYAAGELADLVAAYIGWCSGKGFAPDADALFEAIQEYNDAR